MSESAISQIGSMDDEENERYLMVSKEEEERWKKLSKLKVVTPATGAVKSHSHVK